jgi:glycine cleavage system H protein
LENGLLYVGITDHAQEKLGEIVHVGELTIGAKLNTGQVAGVVESVKAASDLYAPVSGEIIGVNLALQKESGLLNKLPHETWIFTLKPNNSADVNNTLLDADSYQNMVKTS